MELHMELLTIQEFAKLTKLSDDTIRRAIKAGRIHGFRVGAGKRAGYRIPKTEIMRISKVAFEDTLSEYKRIAEQDNK